MTPMTTVREAVQKSVEVFDVAIALQEVETTERAAELLFDAADAVWKLLAPFISPAEVEEDSGYDIEPDDL